MEQNILDNDPKPVVEESKSSRLQVAHDASICKMPHATATSFKSVLSTPEPPKLSGIFTSYMQRMQSKDRLRLLEDSIGKSENVAVSDSSQNQLSSSLKDKSSISSHGTCTSTQKSSDIESKVLKPFAIPPTFKKMMEEGRHPERLDLNNTEDYENIKKEVIHSYKPLQCHQLNEETTDELPSPTFKIRKDSFAGINALRNVQTVNKRLPLADLPLPQPQGQVAFPIPSLGAHKTPAMLSSKPIVSHQKPQPIGRLLSNPVEDTENLKPPDYDISSSEKNLVKQSVSKVENKVKSENDLKTLSVCSKRYTILNLLGSGGSSKVYQVFDTETFQLYAVKIVDMAAADVNMEAGYRNEIKILQMLQGNDRVIKLISYEYRKDLKQLFVVLEKGDTDLASFLKMSKGKRLHLIEIRNYWLQMVMAVDEIHKVGIIHCDLKPANFLFVAGQLKLIDFGIASSVQGNTTSVFKESAVGTSNFMAPEMFESTPQNSDKSKIMYKVKQKSDVWSLGCILYNLVYGHTPFQHIHALVAKVHAITNPNYQIMFSKLDDPLLLDVLKACLTRDPGRRPSIAQLLKHPYLTGFSTTGSESNGVEIDAIVSELKTLTPNRLNKVSQMVKSLHRQF